MKVCGKFHSHAARISLDVNQTLTFLTRAASVPCVHSPAQHQFGVLAVDVLLHQLQQQGSHNVSVVLQLPMQSHCQQGGKVHLGPGGKVVTVLQGTNKLYKNREADRNRQMLN